MLHTKSVEPRLLELLNALMSEPAFNDFNLVGGTSLALQIGHRLSIDIDLFGKCELPSISMMSFNSAQKKSTMNRSIGRCRLNFTPSCFLLSPAFHRYFSALETD